MGRLSPQLEKKIHKGIEPTKCDQCDEPLPNDFFGKEYFVSTKNWSGIAMVYCRGCEDQRAHKFDDVENCSDCGSIVVEDDIVWYDPKANRLDTDKGDPYCVECLPSQASV